MEYIDIFDENNNPIGEVKEKTQAHEEEYRYLFKYIRNLLVAWSFTLFCISLFLK